MHLLNSYISKCRVHLQTRSKKEAIFNYERLFSFTSYPSWSFHSYHQVIVKEAIAKFSGDVKNVLMILYTWQTKRFCWVSKDERPRWQLEVDICDLQDLSTTCTNKTHLNLQPIVFLVFTSS